MLDISQNAMGAAVIRVSAVKHSERDDYVNLRRITVIFLQCTLVVYMDFATSGGG